MGPAARMSALLLLATLSSLALPLAAQPPPGCSTCAKCPVTGVNITLTAGTPAVNFTNGQQLFFATKQAAAAYIDQPREYWLDPFSMPLEGMDGKRGLPDVRGKPGFACPESGEPLTIDMQTPRILHKHGQAIYFCCFGCVTGFWSDPKAVIEGPGRFSGRWS